jgi:hypothetical protein
MAIVKISDLPLVSSPVEGTDLFVVVQDNVTKKAYASDIQTYVGFEEVQYATAGQTVFNLTTMTYAAGANNLQVFVDGVNQYEGLAYTETDNNTVTFTQGLHVGAVVKFSTVQTQTSSVADAGAVTFLQAGTGAVPTNVQAKLRETVSIADFGGDPTGVADSTTAINNAIARAIAAKTPLVVDGHYRHTSQITVSGKLTMSGGAITSDESVNGRSLACFIKDFDGIGFLITGDDCTINGVQFDSVAGRTGDNVQVAGSRFCAPLIAVTNAGQDGLRIGTTGSTGTGNATANCNLFYIGRIAALNNGRYGINIDSTNTGGSGNYPLGLPDANGGYIGLAEVDRNDSDGIRFGNCIDNYVAYIVAQTNTGYGVRFDPYARNNVIGKSYTEANVAGDGIIDADATQNIVYASSRGVTLSDGWTNNGGNSNLLISHTSGVGQDGNFNSCPWHWSPEFYVNNSASGGVAYLGGYVDAGLPSYFKIEKDGAGTGTKISLFTKRNGDTELSRLSVDDGGLMSLQNTEGFALGKASNDTTTAGIFFGDVGSGANTRINMVGSGSSSDTKIAFYNSNGQVGTIVTNGTATAYNIASDYRLKENAVLVDGATALDAVMSWPIKSFTWKANGQSDVGVIAHELQSVKPTAVSGDKDAVKDGEIDPQGVDYSKLVPELVAAVQHLAKQVADLKRNIQE